MAGVDLGNLIHNPANSRGGPVQERIKFDIALKALDLDELPGGRPRARGPEARRRSSCSGCSGTSSRPGSSPPTSSPPTASRRSIRPSATFQVGPLSVGVAAVLDPDAFGALADPDKDRSSSPSSPPTPSCPPSSPAWRRGSEVQVLMVQGPIEEGRRLASEVPRLRRRRHDLEVRRRRRAARVAQRRQDAAGQRRPEGQVRRRRRDLPRLDPEGPLQAPAARRARVPRGRVDAPADRRRLPGGPQVGQGRRELHPPRQRRRAPPGPPTPAPRRARPATPRPSRSWASTKHARAYEPLVKTRSGTANYDAECVSCHVTGFGYTSGFVSAEKTPAAQGQPVRELPRPRLEATTTSPTTSTSARRWPGRPSPSDKTGFCTSCHNEDNDHALHLRRPITPRSSTRRSTPTTTPRSTGPGPPRSPEARSENPRADPAKRNSAMPEAPALVAAPSPMPRSSTGS